MAVSWDTWVRAGCECWGDLWSWRRAMVKAVSMLVEVAVAIPRAIADCTRGAVECIVDGRLSSRVAVHWAG